MDVILAKTAGFCFGVKRAVDTVYQELERAGEEQIYTFGPIIHNEEVIKDMENRGIVVLRSEEELDAVTEGTVIIRSHGVEKRIYDKLNAHGVQMCGCDLSVCEKDSSNCRKRVCGGTFCHNCWKSGSSGSKRNSRLGGRKCGSCPEFTGYRGIICPGREKHKCGFSNDI